MYNIPAFLLSLIFLAPIQIFSQERSSKIDCFSYLMTEADTEVGAVLRELDQFSENDCENFNFGINNKAVWIKIDTQDLPSFSEPLLVLN